MIAGASKRGPAPFDWGLILLFGLLIVIGLVNIYAATYTSHSEDFYSFSNSYVKQAVWIGSSIVLAIIILQVDSKFFSYFGYGFFAFMIFMLVVVLLFGREVNGARSWFELGPIRLQPAEFTKFATALAFAKYLSTHGVRADLTKNQLIALSLLLIPILLIIKQNDTGSALVYSSFILVLYREGLRTEIPLLGVLTVVLFIAVLRSDDNEGILITIPSLALLAYLFFDRNIRNFIVALVSVSGFIALSFLGISFLQINIAFETILIICLSFCLICFTIYAVWKRIQYLYYILFFTAWSIGLTFSVDYVFNNVLSEHHRTRIDVLLGKTEDPQGVGYNVRQSKIAIGSGGYYGKGFLQGTQNKGKFVPEQSTDFIFCTVGEEWGFVGSTAVILLFLAFLWRLIFLAERQRSTFSRIYGYSVAAIIFFHLTINIGMTIGLIPVIGIPLPFFSYGGSSLWSFTILIFIFIRLDSSRDEII